VEVRIDVFDAFRYSIANVLNSAGLNSGFSKKGKWMKKVLFLLVCFSQLVFAGNEETQALLQSHFKE
jgi:hypothetical protein